jgi:hypothetical protein
MPVMSALKQSKGAMILEVVNAWCFVASQEGSPWLSQLEGGNPFNPGTGVGA